MKRLKRIILKSGIIKYAKKSMKIMAIEAFNQLNDINYTCYVDFIIIKIYNERCHLWNNIMADCGHYSLQICD